MLKLRSSHLHAATAVCRAAVCLTAVWLAAAFLAAIALVAPARAQTTSYASIVQEAEAAYQAKDYAESAKLYSRAFAMKGGKGTLNDRYNAACSWALAGAPDSAFVQLLRIAEAGAEIDYDHLLVDPDLNSLHPDARWKDVTDRFRAIKEKAEASINKPLAAALDTIFRDDQDLRNQFTAHQAKYGPDSKEFKDLVKAILAKDSVNVIKVTGILDRYGWLGADVVGRQGASTLFLVIQHADLPVQEKYLPMMREAVKNGKAAASQLALLEDRIRIRHGERQIYGSQIGTDKKTGKSYVLPLEDPDNVDKRRAEVGLEPLADYVARFDLTWDVEAYKKALPEIEAGQKETEKPTTGTKPK